MSQEVIAFTIDALRQMNFDVEGAGPLIAPRAEVDPLAPIGREATAPPVVVYAADKALHLEDPSGALVTASPMIFHAIRLLGAAYLVFLGASALWKSASLAADAQGPAAARDHPDDVCAARLFTPRPRCRRSWLFIEGRSSREAGRCHSQRSPGPSRRRSAARPGCVGRERSADRSGAAGVAGVGRGPGQRRHRQAAEPVRGDGPQLPVGVDCEAWRDQSHRGRPPRPPERVVVRLFGA